MPKKAATKRIGKSPKAKQVDKLTATMKEADSIVFADLSKLKVADLFKLRRNIRQAGGRVLIAKNTLIELALSKAGRPAVNHLLTGPSAMAFGIKDPSKPAKIILDLAKENESVKVKGGILESEVLDPKGVALLSTMPGRTELLGRLVGSINAPAQKLVFALYQAQGKIVYAVDAYRRKLEESAQGA